MLFGLRFRTSKFEDRFGKSDLQQIICWAIRIKGSGSFRWRDSKTSWQTENFSLKVRVRLVCAKAVQSICQHHKRLNQFNWKSSNWIFRSDPQIANWLLEVGLVSDICRPKDWDSQNAQSQDSPIKTLETCNCKPLIWLANKLEFEIRPNRIRSAF